MKYDRLADGTSVPRLGLVGLEELHPDIVRSLFQEAHDAKRRTEDEKEEEHEHQIKIVPIDFKQWKQGKMKPRREENGSIYHTGLVQNILYFIFYSTYVTSLCNEYF